MESLFFVGSFVSFPFIFNSFVSFEIANPRFEKGNELRQNCTCQRISISSIGNFLTNYASIEIVCEGEVGVFVHGLAARQYSNVFQILPDYKYIARVLAGLLSSTSGCPER